MTDMTPLWHRRTYERSHHYRAFMDYAFLGPKRSLVALCAHYGDQAATEEEPKPPTQTLSNLKKWSTRFGWVVRAEAYDQYMIAVEQGERERNAREWVRRELDDAEAMLARWAEAWANTPYHEQNIERIVDDPDNSGQKMRVVILSAGVGKQRSLTKWRRDISDQGRRALGLPDKITQRHQQHSGEIKTDSNWKAFLAVLRAKNQALKDATEVTGDDPPDWD